MIFDDTKFDLFKPNHVENMIKPKVLLCVEPCDRWFHDFEHIQTSCWHVCLPTTKLLAWYRWWRVGMTTQTRRRWNIKHRPSLQRVQPDKLAQIIIRYASSAFLSLFASSLIGIHVFGYGYQPCELIFLGITIFTTYYFRYFYYYQIRDSRSIFYNY